MTLAFGRYMPYNSIIHRLDPRLKLLGLLFILISIFLSTGFTGYALIFVIVMSIFLVAKLPVRMLVKLLKPILFMVVILFIINIFVVRPSDNKPAEAIGLIWSGGNVIFVSWQAILGTIFIGMRIYLVILITTILTGTTKPLDLTLALEDLMSPLKLIKIPVHIISMIIAIALRSIPTLIEEADRIMKAQSSRGIDFRNGNIKDKSKALISLIIPLVVSAFKRAEDLSYAMDARGYDPYAKRTRFRQYHLHVLDFMFLLLAVGLFAFLICYIKIPVFLPYHIPFIDQYATY